MKKIYWYVIGAVVIAAFLFGARVCRSKPIKQTPFTVSLDHIKMLREMHLTRMYFEQIIPIDKRDKLKSLIIAPAFLDAYMNMDELKLESDSVNYKFTLPEIRLSKVTVDLDSAKIYGFKHFGVYFSDNAYSEALEDIQAGLITAKIEITRKAKEQGIERMARQEAKDFIYNWARSVSDKGVSFVEIKN
jgi:hypothetical protein